MDYGEVSGINQRAVQKKQSLTNPKDVRQKCEQIFQLLNCHGSISLFLEPLDPNHPRFNELQNEFINFHRIQLNFRNNKYQNTFQLGIDFRNMWKLGYKLFADDPEKIQKTQQIQQYFDQIFAEVDNKSLITPTAGYPTMGNEPMGGVP